MNRTRCEADEVVEELDTSTRTSRTKKRPRMLDRAPPMVSRFLNASESAKFKEKAPAIVAETQVEDVEQFFRSTDPSEDARRHEISPRVLRAIQANGYLDDETNLRNAVFTELQTKHNIHFVDSSRSTGLAVKLRKQVFRNKVYRETELSSLFSEYERETLHLADGQTTKMETLMHGLPVTTASKPNMSSIVQGATMERNLVPSADSSKAAIDISQQLMFGEFKNGKSYSLLNAVHQCTFYLYALLFWLRAKRGIDVETVYGFTFCGRKCKNHDAQYSVGFVKVSSPKKLNENIKIEYWYRRYRVNDPTGVQYLVHFLVHGSRWQLGSHAPAPRPCRRLLNTFWILPRPLWSDDPSCERELIHTGTMAAVFKVRKRALQRLLRDHFDFDDLFRDWIETLTSQLESETNELYFYVKVRSADACATKYPIGDFYNAMGSVRRDEDLKKTYCFASYNGIFHGVVVSRDRGDRVDAESGSHELPQSIDALCGALRRAATGAVSIARAGYPHSDVLPHNLVFDGKEFHLIDVDEVVYTASRKLPDRNLTYQDDDDFKWLMALEYPNFLRNKPVLYTQVQLVASLLSLANACRMWDDPMLDKVKAMARDTGAWLLHNDQPDNFIDQHNDHVRYTRVEKLCRTVVGVMIMNGSE